MPLMMTTTFTVYKPEAKEPTKGQTLMSINPSWDELKALLLPILGSGCEEIEHVPIVRNDKPVDMFVDLHGDLNFSDRAPLPVNHAVSYISDSTSDRHSGVIHGVAVVFDRVVWSGGAEHVS